MQQNVLPKNVRISLFLLVVLHAFGQAPPSIKQDAKNASCANIVALAGNVSLNCSSLTPTQQKLIDSIPAVLKKILANQLDPAAVMSKLDEILHAINPNAPRVTYLLNGGIRSISPGVFSVSDAPNPAFKEMTDLYVAKDWSALARVCERAMGDTPEWYTPFAFAGIAYANLGQKDRAIELLQRADQGMAGNRDYGNLPEETKRLLSLLRQR